MVRVRSSTKPKLVVTRHVTSYTPGTPPDNTAVADVNVLLCESNVSPADTKNCTDAIVSPGANQSAQSNGYGSTASGSFKIGFGSLNATAPTPPHLRIADATPRAHLRNQGRNRPFE